jgi:hypothetical protein
VHAEEDEQKDNHPLVSILKHGISCKKTTTQLDQPHESGQQKPQNNLNKITRRRQNINPHKAFFSVPSPPISLSLSLSLTHTHTHTHTHPQNYKKKTHNLRNPQTETNKQKHISMTKPFSFFHSYPNNLPNTSLPHRQQQKGEKGWYPQQQQRQINKEKKNDTHKKNNKNKEKKKKNGNYKKKKKSNNNNIPLIEDSPKNK